MITDMNLSCVLWIHSLFRYILILKNRWKESYKQVVKNWKIFRMSGFKWVIFQVKGIKTVGKHCTKWQLDIILAPRIVLEVSTPPPIFWQSTWSEISYCFCVKGNKYMEAGLWNKALGN